MYIIEKCTGKHGDVGKNWLFKNYFEFIFKGLITTGLIRIIYGFCWQLSVFIGVSLVL